MLNKELIIQKCKENGAYISEFTKLVNSETDEEFSEVLLDNLEWLKSKDLIEFIDTKELLKYIGSNNKWIYNRWIFNYCRYVEDRKELWANLTDDYWIYYYCRYVKDRKELWANLTDDYWIYYYRRDVKDRKELRNKIRKKNV